MKMANERKRYHHDYYLSHRDEILERNRKYKEDNKEALKIRRHNKYMAMREKIISSVQERKRKKDKYLKFDYPFIEEWRSKISSERGKFEYDRARQKRKDSMHQHHLDRWEKHLAKNKKIRDAKKEKKFQKRKEERKSP